MRVIEGRAIAAGLTLGLTLLAMSCDRQPNEVVHPTADNLPPPGSPVIRSEGTPLGLDPAALDSWTAARDALLSDWEIVAAFGQQGDIDSDAPDIFGMEIDLIAEGENIFVLDRQNHAVKIFRRNGDFVSGFGRAGSGPGEFRDPAGIERLSDGRLAVVDRGREIKLFSRTDSGYMYTDTHQVDFVPEYACTVGDRVFVSGWRRDRGTMIHELRLTDAGITQDFGSGYQADHWLAEDQLSDGPIACLGDPPRVVLVFERLPVVRAHSADGGGILWTSRNEDYLQPPIVERRDPAGRPSIAFSNIGKRDLVVSVTSISNRHVLLQNVRIEPMPDPADMVHEIRSYLIDAASGQGAYISNSLPLIAAVEPGYHLAKWLLPFPRIEIRMPYAEAQVSLVADLASAETGQ